MTDTDRVILEYQNEVIKADRLISKIQANDETKIVRVVIAVDTRENTQTQCIHVLRGHKFSIYKLTERNYWRAIGMQMKMVKFVI